MHNTQKNLHVRFCCLEKGVSCQNPCLCNRGNNKKICISSRAKTNRAHIERTEVYAANKACVWDAAYVVHTMICPYVYQATHSGKACTAGRVSKAHWHAC